MISILEMVIQKGFNKIEAEKMIRAGKVKIDGKEIFTPSEKFHETKKIVIEKQKKWVSRGALKLLKGLEFFKVDPTNLVCLDIGSSTGGFTQVLLEKGAKHVYALDSGINQLDYKIRINPKVTSLEKTNLKNITLNMFPMRPNLVVADVSFISLMHVFKVISSILITEEQAIVLIKPQFEANSNQVEVGGFVSKNKHSLIIEKIIDFAKDYNFKYIKHSESPIKGKKAGNIEYLALFERK